MNISWIYRVFLYYLMIVDFVKSENWLNGLLRHIVEDSSVRQVIVVTNIHKTDDSMNPGLNVIFRKLMRIIPTVIIDAIAVTNNSWSNDIIADNPMNDNSKTFFLIIDKKDNFDDLRSKRTIEGLLKITQSQSPQFLLLLTTEKTGNNFDELLKYSWTKKLLDFTIIELFVTSVTDNFLNSNYSIVPPIIHEYDPFRGIYTRNIWTTNKMWYPKKANNMHGYPMKIGVINIPPFSLAKFDDINVEPIELGGANIILIGAIAKKMNFTTRWLPVTNFMELKRDPTPKGFHALMASGKLDLHSYPMPQLTKSIEHRVATTATIKFESLCPVVPILPSIEMPLPVDFIEAYVMCFLIVITFWLLRNLLKFHPDIWSAFNVIKTLLSVPVTRQPTKNNERTMFACLLVVSAIYSSHIYSALTNISLRTNAEMIIHTFEDLDKSGLLPIISSYDYNKTFVRKESNLSKIMKKCHVVGSMESCPYEVARNKNVTCFMRKTEITLEIRRNVKFYKIIKVTKPCLWSDGTSFLLAIDSPYRSYIDAVISHLHNSGLVIKWYNDRDINYFDRSKNTNDEEDNEDDDESSDNLTTENSKALHYQLFAVAIVGYTSALLAFFAEFIVYRAVRSRNRKLMAFGNLRKNK